MVPLGSSRTFVHNLFMELFFNHPLSLCSLPSAGIQETPAWVYLYTPGMLQKNCFGEEVFHLHCPPKHPTLPVSQHKV